MVPQINDLTTYLKNALKLIVYVLWNESLLQYQVCNKFIIKYEIGIGLSSSSYFICLFLSAYCYKNNLIIIDNTVFY